MSLSRLSVTCRKCPYKEICPTKRMEAFGYFETPIVTPITTELTPMITASVLQPHSYRDVQIDQNVTVTIDLEEIKQRMKRDFYDQFNLGIKIGR